MAVKVEYNALLCIRAVCAQQVCVHNKLLPGNIERGPDPET